MVGTAAAARPPRRDANSTAPRRMQLHATTPTATQGSAGGPDRFNFLEAGKGFETRGSRRYSRHVIRRCAELY